MRGSDQARWQIAADACRQERIVAPDFDVADYFFVRRYDWFELIKAIRTVEGCGLFEATAFALRHDGWRRWCEMRVRTDRRCASEAQRHREKGGLSLFEDRAS